MDNEKRIICCDKIPLAQAKITDDGFIVGEAVVTRAGIFKYITADGKVSRRLRPPEEVTKKSHLDSMKMMPITERHPRESWVDSKNARQSMVGQTGENVRVSDNRPIVPIKILDAGAVEKVKSGKLRELSLGYTAVIDNTPGTYNGEHYDCIQRDMCCNHLALVEKGRANADNNGEFAQVNLCDSGESIWVLDSNVDDIHVDFNNKTKEGEDMPNMVKITLDSIQYDAAPEVANALEKAQKATDDKQKELDDANVAYKNLKNDHEKLQAQHDTLADELKKAKAANDSLDVNALAKARLKIIDEARAILGDEAAKKFDEMSDMDIKKAVVKDKSPDLNLDELSDVYIDARYDGCVEYWAPNPDAIASQRVLAKTPQQKVNDSDDARKSMIAKLFNGGKAPSDGGN